MQGDGGRDERAPADSGLRQRTACNAREMLNQISHELLCNAKRIRNVYASTLNLSFRDVSQLT